MKHMHCIAVPVFLLAALPCLFAGAFAEAADLRPDTLKAWVGFIAAQERRINAELNSPKGFLAMDFQNSCDAEQERQAVLAGAISIKRMNAGNNAGESNQIRDGMIHHWRGSMFVPGVTLDFVLSRVQHPELEKSRQEDVLDSRVLESSPNQIRLYLKLQRSQIVTVVYNTEHIVKFTRYGRSNAFSSSIATKISEIERLPGNMEREKPEGHDRGFLWRMNSYWRYQQMPGGVIVECESMTLSRSIPFPLGPIAGPIINNIAEESMQRTLNSLRVRLEQAYKTKSLSGSFQGMSPAPCLPDADAFQGHFLSNAALAVVGSIIKKDTQLPMATDINSVATRA